MALDAQPSPRVRNAYARLHRIIVDMPDGKPLPAFPALMKRLGASQLTIQRACDLLEQQGLIRRVPGKGIFRANPGLTGTIGLVMKPESLGFGASPYYAAVASHIGPLLAQASHGGLRLKTILGPQGLNGRDFSDRIDLSDDGKPLRGVVSFWPLNNAEDRLWAQGIPVVGLSPDPFFRVSVGSDRQSNFQTGFQLALDAGARRLAVISHYDAARLAPLLAPARAMGLGLPAQRVCSVEPDYEAAGFQAMTRLWDSPARPDCVFVTDDIVCNGVLRALLTHGIDTPNPLKLFTFANKGITLAYHKPVTRIEFDWRQQCAEAVSLLVGCLSTGVIPPARRLLLPASVVPGQTT